MSFRNLNLALRFLLELCGLLALGYWGFQTGQTTFERVQLGFGAPLLAAFAWGIFVSPKARVPLSAPFRTLLALLILGLAAFALAATGHPALGGLFALLILLNHILFVVWRQ